MTVNAFTTPNSLHVCANPGVNFHFGHIQSVTPVHIAGDGHHDHIDVRFSGGLKIALDPAAVTELARRFPEALAALGGDW